MLNGCNMLLVYFKWIITEWSLTISILFSFFHSFSLNRAEKKAINLLIKSGPLVDSWVISVYKTLRTFVLWKSGNGLMGIVYIPPWPSDVAYQCQSFLTLPPLTCSLTKSWRLALCPYQSLPAKSKTLILNLHFSSQAISFSD